MVKFKKLLLSVMAISIIGVLLVSCDKSGDEEVTVHDVGVYKIEISLLGNLENYRPCIAFKGVNTKMQPVFIFDEKGNKYEKSYSVDYDDAPFTSVMAYTNSDCKLFDATMLVTNIGMQAGNFTIKCKGYYNGKLVKESEKTVNLTATDRGVTAYFDSEQGLVIMSMNI